MSEEINTLAQLLNLLADSVTSKVNTVFIAQVVGVKENPYRVDLKLCIRDNYFDEEDNRKSIQLPTIPNRPVLCMHGGEGRLIFPVAVNDYGLYITSKQSIDKWLSSGGSDIDPGLSIPHGITDGFYLGVLQPYSKHWASHSGQQLSFGFENGSKIDIGKTTNDITMSLSGLSAQLKLGGNGASESVIKGDMFLQSLNTNVITVLQALAVTGAKLVSIPLDEPLFFGAYPVTTAALTALGSALNAMIVTLLAFQTALPNFKSLQVKTV